MLELAVNLCQSLVATGRMRSFYTRSPDTLFSPAQEIVLTRLLRRLVSAKMTLALGKQSPTMPHATPLPSGKAPTTPYCLQSNWGAAYVPPQTVLQYVTFVLWSRFELGKLPITNGFEEHSDRPDDTANNEQRR